jgi:mono/diheme cytochrome c family protein
MSDVDMNDKVKRGFYLVTIAHCVECHTPSGRPAPASISRIRSQGRP